MALDAMNESQLEADEAEPMQAFIMGATRAYNDPTGETALPTPPAVKSKSNQAIIQRTVSGFAPYSAMAQTQKFKQDQMVKKLERARAVEQRFPEANVIKETPNGFQVDDEQLRKFETTLMTEQRNLEAVKLLAPNQRGQAIKELRESGRYSEEILQALEQSAGGAETIRQRNAKAAVEAMRNRNEQRGLNVDEDRLRKIEERILMTGNVQPMPVEQLSTMSAKFGVMELMDEFLDGVKQWEKEFPGRNFDENLGVIPRTQREVSALLQKETDPAKVRAIELLVPLAFAQNTELKTTSGATVTPQEANRLAMAIGNQMDKNTVTKMKAFRKSYEKGLRKDIAIYDGYYIPEFFQDFAVAKPKPGQETVNVLQFVNERTGMQPSGIQVPAASPSGATNAPVLPAGWKFNP